MNQSSDTIWDRIVAWFRGLLGTSTGQDGSTGTRSGSGGLSSMKDKASQAASRAQSAASQAADRAQDAVGDLTAKAKGAVNDTSSRAQSAVGSTSDTAKSGVDQASNRANDAIDNGKSRLSGAAASVTSRGYDTGSKVEASDATIEDMDASGQDNTGTATSGSTSGTGTTAEDLDQTGTDTAERNQSSDSGGTGSFSGNDVTSEENAPSEVGEGITYSPSPQEHPEADQAATDVGSSGRPFAHTGDDWWDTDRPGMGTGSSLGEQGAGSETGTEGSPSGADLGPSASAADVGTSTSGASYGGVDASGSGTDAAGSQTSSATMGSTSTITTAPGSDDTDTSNASQRDDATLAPNETSARDIVAGYGESGAVTTDTSRVGVDSPDTAPGVGYEGSSPATDREGVGSYAPSAATDGGTGASSNDLGLVQDAPDDAEVRAADQANAAAAGTTYAEDETADANAGTDFDEQPDDSEDYSTAQGIVVGGLIAEDQQETGGQYTDELLVDAETQQTELPAADYEDLPTDTADTTEDVTTTLGDQTTPAPTQASTTGTTGRGQTPDTAEGSAAAYEASYGAPRDAGAGTGVAAGTGTGAEEEDANAPTAGVKGVNWVPGDGGTEAPEGFPLKGNASSMIYHPKESSTYNRTIAEYYFATPEDAEAAGYRLPKALQTNSETPATGDRRATSPAPQTQAPSGTATAGQAGKMGQPSATAKQTSSKAERPAPKGAIRVQGANCPDDHPIKGNANSRIYHMPSESSYEQTIPEFCFASEADAKAAGFRARKH